MKFSPILRAICFSGLTFAFLTDIYAANPPMTMEEGCFKILASQVDKDPRFGSTDLYKVKLNERKAQKTDMSDYQNFLDNRIVNSSKNNGDPHLFYMSRNNIGTIAASANYIASQFTPFGNQSNFEFPLRSDFPGSDTVPDGSFKGQILYTHHLIQTGDFLSCGYLQIVPKNGRTLLQVGPDAYKTNIFVASGFQDDGTLTNNGDTFRVGRATVTANDWNDKPSFTINILTVLYDNNSSILNEFETFPYQVKAMTDTDNQKSVTATQQRFMQLLRDNTCMKLIHSNTSDLPSKCGGKYGFLDIKNHLKNLASSLARSFNVPTTYANIAVDQIDEKQIEIAKTAEGGLIFGIPSELYNKLLQIGEKKPQDVSLREYLKLALSPIEATIKVKKSFSVPLFEHEEKIDTCGIGLLERQKIIRDFVQKLDVDAIDMTQLSYLNPKFGDCVIPFPDKTHRNTIVPDSYEFNKILAGAAPKIVLESKNKDEIKKILDQKNELDLAEKKEQDELIGTGSTIESLSPETVERLNAMKEAYAAKRKLLEDSMQKLFDDASGTGSLDEASGTTKMPGLTNDQVGRGYLTKNQWWMLGGVLLLLASGLFYLSFRKQK